MMPVEPLSPGSAPITTPIRVPKDIIKKANGLNTFANPAIKFCSIFSSYPSMPFGRRTRNTFTKRKYTVAEKATE